MFDNLSERLERSFKILKGEGRITEINVAETVKDIRKALLEADVNYKTAKLFTDRVKEKAMGQSVMTAVRPGQLMIKITHDELAELMGGQAAELNLKPVTKGDFTQEHYLAKAQRSLISSGAFIMAQDKGIVFDIQQPFPGKAILIVSNNWVSINSFVELKIVLLIAFCH